MSSYQVRSTVPGGAERWRASVAGLAWDNAGHVDGETYVIRHYVGAQVVDRDCVAGDVEPVDPPVDPNPDPDPDLEGESTIEGLTISDLGIPVLPDGTIGAEGPGTDPIPMVMNPPTASTRSTDGSVPALCSAGSVTSSFTSADVTASTEVVEAQISVPERADIIFDLFRQDGFYDADLQLLRLNDDGTTAIRDERSIPNLDNTSLVPNVALDRDVSPGNYIMRFRVSRLLRGGIGADGAINSSFNFRFVDGDGNETSLCPFAEAERCFGSGGNLFLEEPIEFRGEMISGCQSYESCVSTITIAVLDSLSEFACRNDELLGQIRTGLEVGAALLALPVAGGLAVAAVGPRAAATIRAALAIDRGVATIQAGLGTVALVVAGATIAQLTLVDPVLPDIPIGQYISTLGEVSSTVIGELAQSPPGVDESRMFQAVQQIIEQGDFVAQIDQTLSREAPNADPEDPERVRRRETLIRAVSSAIETCIAFATFRALPEEFVDRVVGEVGGTLVNGVNGVIDRVEGGRSHICEFVNIYLPGTRTDVLNTAGRNITEQTLHIAETLGDISAIPGVIQPQGGAFPDFAGWTNPWTTCITDIQEQGLCPQPRADPTQALLTRTADRGDNETWRTGPPLLCQGTGSVQCDEWPPATTTQNQAGRSDLLATNLLGPPRAHLRFINSDHNTAGGRELGRFLEGAGAFGTNGGVARCRVEVGDPYIVIPQPIWLANLTLDGRITDTSVSAIDAVPWRSTSVC